MKKIINGHIVIDITGMSDDEIRNTVAEIIRNHPRKGAINILEAMTNAPLADYIKSSTSFLDNYSFNFATRCYVFANRMTLEDMPHCQYCGKLITWNVISVHKGFIYKYCSSKCNANSKTTKTKRQQTKTKKYGDPNWNNHEQAEQTCLKKYGAKCSLQNEDVKTKSRATKSELYGNPHYVNTEQAIQTRIELYGMGQNGKAISEGKRKAAEADPEYYEKQLMKQQATKTEKYGDPNWNNHEQASATKTEKYGDPNWNNHERTAVTKTERYGDPNWNNHEQAERTCLKKYGVSNYAQTDEFKAKSEATCMANFGAKNFSQSDLGKVKLSESRNRMSYEKFLSETNKVKPLFSIDEYLDKGSHDESLRWKCLECGKEFEAPVNFIYARETGNFVRCLDCHPITFCRSHKQNDMYDVVARIVGEKSIRKDDRSAIYPKEIDVFVPELNAGFEFDGLFWHSAYWQSNLTHLSEKTGLCADKDIVLYHVFEDEWDNRRNAVEDRIATVLLGNNMECGKNLRIVKTDWNTAESFYAENSVDMFIRKSDYNYGLTDENKKYVSMLSFNANAGKIVINAFQNAVNMHFKDSFKTLTDTVMSDFMPKAKEMTMKIDMRWPDTSIFENTGFRFVKFTTPKAWLVDSLKWKRLPVNVTKKTMSRFFKREFDSRPLIDQLHELDHTLIADCGKMLFSMKLV